MNRVLMLVLVLGAALPAVAQAQYGSQTGSAQQVLLAGFDAPAAAPAPGPITLDLNLPGESTWVQRINDNPSLPPSSPGAAALNAQVKSQPIPGQQIPGQASALGCCDNGCNSCDGCNVCCQDKCWPPPGVYCKHTFELEYVTGFWPSITNRGLPGVGVVQNDFIPQIVRLGMMWNNEHPDRDRVKGCFEGIIELDCLPITSGAGNIVIGGSLLLRYNFRRHFHKRLVPFFQFGGGGEYTDAYLFPASPTGNPFNFILQIGGGAHYFLNEHWALSAELVYFHMSNSGISPNNLGYNFVNGLFGVSYYFGRNMR